MTRNVLRRRVAGWSQDGVDVSLVRDVEAGDVQKVLDHLSLDADVEGRVRMKTAMGKCPRLPT